VARDFSIFAAEIYQRLAFIHLRVLYFPDKDRMVASQMRGNHLATHVEKRAINDQNSPECPPYLNSQPLFRFDAVFAFCEVFRDGLLVLF